MDQLVNTLCSVVGFILQAVLKSLKEEIEEEVSCKLAQGIQDLVIKTVNPYALQRRGQQ